MPFSTAVRIRSVGNDEMNFGSCMCFSSSSFTVGLLFRIARDDDEIPGYSCDQCHGICSCTLSLTFVKFITAPEGLF